MARVTEYLAIDRTDLPLPSTQSKPQSQQKTPAAHSGSFFINHDGRCPVDGLTGMPLPIAPVGNLETVPAGTINEHHHFYPRLSPVLHDSLGGRALRVSRIQRVLQTQHNFGDNPYHRFFPIGPEVPLDPDAQLGMCVLACAGYLPERVVDTATGEPLVRPMRDWEFRRLTRPSTYMPPLPYQVKRFRDRRFPGLALIDAKTELINSRRKQAELSYYSIIYGFDPMRKFMLERILSLDFSVVDRAKRRDFLEKDDVEAGLCLLAIGAGLAAKSATIKGRGLTEVYADIRGEGRMHHLMPPSPSTLIKNKLGHITDRIDILPSLKARLEYQRQQAVA